MPNPGRDDTLSDTEIENLRRLEKAAQRCLRCYTEVGAALAEIRDAQLYRGTHSTFAAYLRDRWDISDSLLPRREESEPAAEVCQQVLRALESSELTVADLRVTLHKVPRQGEPPAIPGPDSSPSGELVSDRILPQLRWLMTQSAGTIADVAHQLETHPFNVDEGAREQLRDDVLVIEEELAALKMLLAYVDWDAEFRGLLGEENPPPEPDDTPEDE